MQFYFVEMDDHSTLYVSLTLSTDDFSSILYFFLTFIAMISCRILL